MSSEDLPLAVPAYLAISSDGIIEGSVNLFFTQARARASISLTGSPSYLTYSSTTGIFNSVYNFNQNLLTSSSPSFNGLTVGSLSGVLKATAGLISGSSTTTDLPEGTNLYYTSARFNTAFAAKTTADLAELTNLYFTNTRAQNAISLTGSPSYLTYISGVFNSVYDFNQNLLTTSSPTFNALTLTTALPVSSGGTGQNTYTNGQLLIGNTTGNTLTKATLTAGSSNISITNGTGSITLDTSLTPTLSTLTLTGAVGATGQIYMNNGTSNTIYFNTSGSGAPTFTTRSAGTKMVLYPALSGSAADYALGIESNAMWYSVANTTASFYWYTGTTRVATLSNTQLDLGNNGNTPMYLTTTANAGNESTIFQFKRTANAATHYMYGRIHSAGSNYLSYNLYNGSTNVTSVIITPVGITCGTTITIDNTAALRVYGYQSFGNSFTVAAPAFTTRSTGTCVVLRDALSGSAADYALGVNTNVLWYSVPTTSQSHLWYAGTTNIATLSGAGALTTAAGHILTTGGITLSQANQTITAATGLTLQQTGDTYGTTRLSIQNRVGVNGALFEQAGSVDLMDFVFKGLANQRNIRYENRGVGSGSFVLAPEFQIGTAGSMNCIIADAILAIKHEFRIYSSTSTTNYIAFRSDTSSGNYTLTYPAATGSANQFLYTNGSGVLAWTGLAASDTNANLTYSGFTYSFAASPTFTTLNVNGVLSCDTSFTIDSVSIGATALDYCNDINQQLTTTSSPTFGGLLATGSGYTVVECKTTSALNAYYKLTTPSYAYSIYADGVFDALAFYRDTGGGALLGYFSGTLSFILNVALHPYAGIDMKNVTSNLIQFNTAGVAAPTTTSRSAGTKICLYNGLSGSTVDYALGINAATFWSSVPSSSESYKWYAATSVILTLSGGGDLTTTGNIIMPTSGGTAANLNYYEEYTANLSFSGACFTGSQDVAIKINRIGKAITFTMTNLTVAASGTSTVYTTAASSVPSRLVPAYTLQIPMRVMNNSAGQLGLLLIQTDGTVAVYFGIDGVTSNTNSGNCGHYPISVSYCL